MSLGAPGRSMAAEINSLKDLNQFIYEWWPLIIVGLLVLIVFSLWSIDYSVSKIADKHK
jgi:hypothetical protein